MLPDLQPATLGGRPRARPRPRETSARRGRPESRPERQKVQERPREDRPMVSPRSRASRTRNERSREGITSPPRRGSALVRSRRSTRPRSSSDCLVDGGILNVDDPASRGANVSARSSGGGVSTESSVPRNSLSVWPPLIRTTTSMPRGRVSASVARSSAGHYGWPKMQRASSRTCRSRTRCSSSTSTPSAGLRSTRRRRCGGSSGT